jgi:hypothetical protein
MNGKVARKLRKIAVTLNQSQTQEPSGNPLRYPLKSIRFNYQKLKQSYHKGNEKLKKIMVDNNG